MSDAENSAIQGQTSVQPHLSVNEYFHDVLAEALRSQGVEASAHAEFYLVNLLSEYCHTALFDQPLSLLIAEAQAAEPNLRVKKLREVGDHSLYVSGFFADSLESRMIDVDYYIALGGKAYDAVARSCSTPPWAETFSELSNKFQALVEVLCEVAARTPLRTNTDVLQLYERYVRTGSKWTERRLRRMGLGLGRKDGGMSA